MQAGEVACVVCMEAFDADDAEAKPSTFTGCAHRFHVHCLGEWGRASRIEGRMPSCPTCRTPIEVAPAPPVQAVGNERDTTQVGRTPPTTYSWHYSRRYQGSSSAPALRRETAQRMLDANEESYARAVDAAIAHAEASRRAAQIQLSDTNPSSAGYAGDAIELPPPMLYNRRTGAVMIPPRRAGAGPSTSATLAGVSRSAPAARLSARERMARIDLGGPTQVTARQGSGRPLTYTSSSYLYIHRSHR